MWVIVTVVQTAQSLRLVSLFSFFLFVDMSWVLKSLYLHLLILLNGKYGALLSNLLIY